MRLNFASVDKTLLVSTIALIVMGLIVLSSASAGFGQQRFNDASYYLKHQLLIALIVGLPLFLLAFFIHYRIWRKFALVLFILNLILLAAVFISPFSVTLKGSARWIQVWGGYTFQPSEFLKITLVLYLAALFEKRKWQASSFKKGFLPFLTVLAISTAAVAIEPDITTAAVIAGTAVAVYLLAGAKIRHSLLLAIIVITAFLILIYLVPHGYNRLMAYLNKGIDQAGSGYHFSQVQNVIISGGLKGAGFEQGLEKYRFLPEPFGDSIFAVAAKEFGFIGASLILLAFLVFIIRGFTIALRAPDTFGRLVAAGLVTTIGLQAFINLSAMVGLLPLSGLPLPFMSYGGSALSANLFSVGLLLNISRYQRD